MLSHIKIAKKILTFGNIEIEKNKFYSHKSPAFLNDVDIKKVLISKKTCSGKKNYKYFIGYLYNDHKGKPLHIILLKTSTYGKRYDGQINIIPFGIKSVLISKNNLIASLSITKFFWKPE